MLLYIATATANQKFICIKNNREKLLRRSYVLYERAFHQHHLNITLYRSHYKTIDQMIPFYNTFLPSNGPPHHGLHLPARLKNLFTKPQPKSSL